MRVEIAPDTLAAAQAGNLAAIDAVLTGIQPAIYNLAVRMLGHREDARDACQEILLKVVTHLGGWRGEARFSTWVFQVARNHLLTARTRSRESPEVSLEALEAKLGDGLALAGPSGPAALTPEDKAAAREIAAGCTQTMLMCLDRDRRLAYLLDVIFGLDSAEASAVLGISAAAYRKRLSRARADLDAFAGRTCGLVAPGAACRCVRQVPAWRSIGGADPRAAPDRAGEVPGLDGLMRLSDLSAVFRADPGYWVPAAMAAAIRAVLHRGGWAGAGPDRSGT